MLRPVTLAVALLLVFAGVAGLAVVNANRTHAKALSAREELARHEQAERTARELQASQRAQERARLRETPQDRELRRLEAEDRAALAEPQFHYSRDVPICDREHLALDQRGLAYCMQLPTLKGAYQTPSASTSITRPR